MLLSALFNVDHKEAVSGLKASVPPSGKGCCPWSSPIYQTESCLKSMPGRCEYYLFQQEQDENVQLQTEVKPVHWEPTAQVFLSSPVLPLSSCPREVLGACTHIQLPLRGPCWPHRDHSHPSAGKDHLSSCPLTSPAVILISRSHWRPFPHLLLCSAAPCHIPCMGTRSACKCWWQQCSCDTNFSRTNLCNVRDVSQILEFYQLRRAEPGPPLKNGGHSCFTNLQLWDMSWRKL